MRTLLDLNLIEEQIYNLYKETGDDIHDVLNHGDTINFSHVRLIEKNFSYALQLSKEGILTLTKQVSIYNKSVLDADIDINDGSSETLLKSVTVKSDIVNDIDDIVNFILEACE